MFPVNVLSGAIKTTRLNDILNNREGHSAAVSVNDMSEVNIDAELVKKGGAELSHTQEKLVEMSNGYICSTLREDLLVEAERLAHEDRVDYLLIESTAMFDVALLNNAELRLGKIGWKQLPDPFPVWGNNKQAA